MKKSLLAVVLALSMTSLFAASSNVSVGLGRKVLGGKDGLGWEILATFLNGLSSNGYFAMSSGSWGYEKGIKIPEVAVADFVNENMDALAMDIAAGNGEYLDTVSAMLAVSDVDAFKAAAHENFATIFASEEVSAEEVVAKLSELAI